MENITTVGELATAVPHSIGVLERLGIDYCCNGGQLLETACQTKGLTRAELLTMVQNTPVTAADETNPWTNEKMSSLIRFIVDAHHRYTRETLEVLASVGARVREVHGRNHPELQRVDEIIGHMSADLLPHMLKEEQVLFPYINSLEQAKQNGTEPDMPFFGTAKNPVRMMMAEHEAVGEMLVEIRKITENFALPPEACRSYRMLFAKLEEIEKDLHRHIHLENNVLFPRAIATEEEIRTTPIPANFNVHTCAK